MFIYSNLAISLDGKIAPANRSFCPLGTPLDRKRMVELRKNCDALLIGASTFRPYRKASRADKRAPAPINIVVSRMLEGISPNWPFFKAKDLKRILFVQESPPKARLAKFEKTSEIIVLKKTGSIAKQILKHLKARGIQRLLIEGGGEIMWHFASQNLINEYHVTLTPKIVGGKTSPTLVDGIGFKPKDILGLKLLRSEVLGDEIYLTFTSYTAGPGGTRDKQP